MFHRIFMAVCLISMFTGSLMADAYAKYGKPRIMILISETIDGKPTTANSAEKQIEKFFLGLGFKVIDKTQMETIKDRDKATFISDPGKAAALGARYGAELIIVGTAEAAYAMDSDYGGIKMHFFDANIDLKAVRTDVATVLLVEDATARKGSNGNLKAAKDALKAAGKTIAEKMEKQLQSRWGTQLATANEVNLVVSNIDFPGLGKLEPALKKIKGVNNVYMRSMQNNTAVFDIELEKITVADFQKALTAIPDPKVGITGLTKNRIDARIGGAAPVKVGKAGGASGSGPAIDIEEVKLSDLFPSQYNYYTQHPIGTIKVKNHSDAVYKKVKVSIHIPKYMELRSEQIIKELPGGKEVELPVNVSLNNDEILKIDENTKTQAEIKLAYYEGEKETVIDRIAPVTIYDRNSIDWKQKNSIAAFVTPKDDVVKAFARKAISSVKEDALKVSNRNMKNAVTVYNALAALGIKYLSDPNTSFSERALDHVQYPRETILYKTGDCDDTSVLLASMLESIGLTTGMIASTDHIFMMFDTGVMPRNALQLGFGKDMFIERDGRLWIPLETTRLDKSFLKSWELGIKEYNNLLAKAIKPEVTPVRMAWKVYTSVALPEAVKEESWSFPGKNAYDERMTADGKELADAVSGNAQALIQQLQYAVKKNGKDLAAHARLCAALVHTGRTDEAAKALDAAFKVKGAKQDAALLNAQGNLAFVGNRFADALKSYKAAAKAGKGDGGYKVNMGFACFAMDKEDEAAGHFAQGIKAFKTGEAAMLAMGFDVRNLNGYLDNLSAGGAVAGQRGSYIEDDEADASAEKKGDGPVTIAASDGKKKGDAPVTVADASGSKKGDGPVTIARNKDPKATARRNKMLDDALASLNFDVEETKAGKTEFGGRRGADPTQIKNIKTLLYWKE